MAREAKFFVRMAPEGVVGPHALKLLRKWVYFEVISQTAMVCEEGKEPWQKISDVPEILNIPADLKKLWNSIEKPRWWSDPVTEKQLKKLDYFNLPYSRKGLNKGRASQLIGCFIEIDPQREKQYQNRPATAEQRQLLCSLGHDSGPGLSYSEARDLIEEIESERRDKDDEENFQVGVLENFLNDEDWRELLGYKKLNEHQLKALARYLVEHPEFKHSNTKLLAEIAMSLFPEIKKKIRQRKETHAKKAGCGGCLGLLIIGSIVWAVVSAYVANRSNTRDPEPAANPSESETKPSVQGSNVPPNSTPIAMGAKSNSPAPLRLASKNGEAAKLLALKYHPDLGVRGSALNLEFVARYKRYQTEKPEFFNNPAWPQILVEESVQALKAKQ